MRTALKEIFRRLWPTAGKPVPVRHLWMMPDGFYRMRNGETVRVEHEGEALCRKSGGSLPSLIELRWNERGHYTEVNPFHPFDLVEYLGARI